MVERLVWDQEAAGSSPVIPTKIIQRKDVAIMILTSAAANKMIRQMKEEISSIVSKENKCSVVHYSEGDEPIRPEYSFEETQKKIQEINSKIIKLRHAVNMMNVSTSLPGLDITVDEALVEMSMLNEMKNRLSRMKDEIKISKSPSLYNSAAQITEQLYDPAEAAAEFKNVSDRLSTIQLALDHVNLTESFEVDI